MFPDTPVEERGQRTLAAIVLTDAVGFSARMSEDEEMTLFLIQKDLKLIESLCQEFEGQVIKSTGDGLLMFFSSAVKAVSCSLAVQQQLIQSHETQNLSEPLQHRIGIHLGDVLFRNGDVLGNGVNIAARLQTEAYPGGICISQTVYDVVKSRLSLNAFYAGALQLKNIKDPQPAYHVYPDGHEPPAEANQITEVEPPAPPPVVRPSRSSPSVPPSPQSSLEPGSTVGGRYNILRVLGQGGFGRSYLVEDSQRFGEFCVLKEFSPASTSKRNLQKALDLFKREAKTLYQINHPQIPKFMACFTQGQRLFIVQEYINGVTYAQLLRQRKREGRSFSQEEVLDWLIHMLQVLDYLHSLNVVHRDISPDNVMYSSDRNLPILIDFGLVNDAMNSALSGANDEDENDDEAEKKRSATLVGKFGYSPPEQIQLGQCFPSSDLYALGVTAIVLLTGKYPRELMNQGSLEWDWQRHVEVPEDFVRLLHKMTFPKPNGRFQTAQAVLEATMAIATNPSSPLPQPPTQPIDLTIDGKAAPLFDAPLQRGQAIAPDPAFVDQCRQELTRSIGPIASVVIDDVLEQYPGSTPQELVALLAAQLSDGDRADDFTSRICAKSGFLTPQELAFSADPASGEDTTAPQLAEPISPEFRSRCRQALLQAIGPMADFLIEETLTDFPDLDARGLVAKLAAEIPNVAKAREFRQQLQ